MTKQQAACLGFIRKFIAEHGYSPSYEEIGTAMGGIAKSGVHRLVHALADAQQIRVWKNRNRSIELVGSKKGASVDGLSLLDAAVKAIEDAHGVDDGHSVLIIATPAEVSDALRSVLA